MKYWILTILFLGGKLERAADRLDEQMATVALDPFGDTVRQCEKLSVLCDVKRRLVNLHVLSHRLRCDLTDDDVALLRRCMRGESYGEIAAAMKISKATAYRHVKRVIDRCTDVLLALGFDADRMERDYADIRLVAKTRAAFAVRSMQDRVYNFRDLRLLGVGRKMTNMTTTAGTVNAAMMPNLA